MVSIAEGLWVAIASAAIVSASPGAIALPQLSTETPTKNDLPIYERRTCPATLEPLVTQMIADLPGYANRVIQRTNQTYVPYYVIVAGNPQFEPLPLGPGRTPGPGSTLPDLERSPDAPSPEVRQAFLTTLERNYLDPTGLVLEGYHWLFLTRAEDGWRLVTIFSQTRRLLPGEPPTPPQESSDSAIAQAIRLWLRDCRHLDFRF
jgi:hypothetical protein